MRTCTAGVPQNTGRHLVFRNSDWSVISPSVRTIIIFSFPGEMENGVIEAPRPLGDNLKSTHRGATWGYGIQCRGWPGTVEMERGFLVEVSKWDPTAGFQLGKADTCKNWGLNCLSQTAFK